jgi:hypothetical protein
LAVLELGSTYIVKHNSVTYVRVSRQYAEAVKIRPAPPGEPLSVLMVGNSLLLYGVDVEQLQEQTSSRFQVYPIFMEGAGYFDWLYGLRRLFLRGSRPQVIVMGLEAYSILNNGVWDETPMLLLNSRDVLGLASELGLDRTATSDLLLSHLSVYWGMRSLFRRRIISHLIPHYEDLVPFLRPDDLTLPQSRNVQPTIISRLETLRELCEANGAKMILVIPPTFFSENAVKQMAIASQKAGVEAIVPIEPTMLPARFYQPDYIHLNPQGAVRFTSALAAELPKTIVVVTNRSL